MERLGIRSILSVDADFDRWPGLKRIYESGSGLWRELGIPIPRLGHNVWSGRRAARRRHPRRLGGADQRPAPFVPFAGGGRLGCILGAALRTAFLFYSAIFTSPGRLLDLLRCNPPIRSS